MEETRHWCSLPEDVIQRVAETLKRLRNWRREGRALRTLNRHWCRCISNQISEIRPHSSRPLTPEDAKAFVKFPFVSRVNVTYFLSDLHELHCGTVIEALKAMARISCLELGICEETSSFLKSSRLSELTGITSVAMFRNRKLSHCTDSHVLGCLGQLRLEEITIDDGMYSLGSLLSEVPSLQRLDLNGYDLKVSGAVVAKLRQLESLALHYNTLPVPQLATLSRLVSVGVEVHPRDMKQLTLLTQISSLSLRLEIHQDNEVQLGCLSSLSKLTTLCLRSGGCLKKVYTLGATLSQLKRFDTYGGQMTGTQIRSCMPALEVLRLRDCVVHESDALEGPVPDLRRLEVTDTRRRLIHARWLPEMFPNLSALSVNLSVEEGRAIERLDSLLSLTQLEKVAVGIVASTHDAQQELLEEIKKLEDLQSLRDLMIFGRLRSAHVFTVLSLGFLTRLESLAIDLTNFCGTMRSDAEERIQERVPHLVFETDMLTMVETRSQWFSPCD